MGHKLYSIKGSAAAILAAATLAVLGVVAAMVAAPAHATPLDNTCPVQFAASIYTCDTMPVGIRTNRSSDSSFSSHIKIVVHSSFTANVQEYEKIKHVVVGFNMMANGFTNPKKGTCRTFDAAWGGWKTANGKIVFTKDTTHGMTHACWDGHNWRQVGGDSQDQWNCGNIVYPYGQRPPKKAVIVPRVVGFHSHAEFNSVFEKWVTGSNHSTGSTTRDTEYYCRTAGYNPGVVNGREVCFHVTQIPGTPTPTTTPTGPIVCSNIGNNNGGNCNVTTTSSTTVTTPTTTVVTTTTPTSTPTCTLNLSEAKGDQTVTASIGVSGGSATATDFIWGDGHEDPGSQMAVQHTYAALAPAPAGTYTERDISAKAVIGGNWVSCGTAKYLQANPTTNPTGTNPNGAPGLPNG